MVYGALHRANVLPSRFLHDVGFGGDKGVGTDLNPLLYRSLGGDADTNKHAERPPSVLEEGGFTHQKKLPNLIRNSYSAPAQYIL